MTCRQSLLSVGRGILAIRAVHRAKFVDHYAPSAQQCCHVFSNLTIQPLGLAVDSLRPNLYHE